MNLQPRFKLSIASLVFVNLLPLLGVLAFGWSVSPIMLLYWSENVVVGFFNVLKMAKAQGAAPADLRLLINGRPVQTIGRRPLIRFFLLHYGLFTFVHGVFVFILFGFGLPSAGSFFFAMLMLFASHGLSYRRHFIGGGEYERISFAQLFWQPYKRVVVMHITILAGGFLAQMHGSPPLALGVMVLLKTAIDLFSHLREHRKLLKPVAPTPS